MSETSGVRGQLTERRGNQMAKPPGMLLAPDSKGLRQYHKKARFLTDLEARSRQDLSNRDLSNRAPAC
jgi:hypothetical protein